MATGAMRGTELEVSVVLPTFNERENLGPVLSRLTAALDGLHHEVLVVDDDSPDRTWEVAEQLCADYPQVRVIRRRGEHGLSSAVVRGFREAKGEILAVMDADLQHDASVLAALVQAARTHHFAVASRGVEGGSFGRWGWHRRATSWAATTLARLVAGVSLSDPMSGFFALRREVFAELDDGRLRPQGFKILLELYLRARRLLGPDGVTVREVGYVFRARLHGQSKLTARVAWEYLRMLYGAVRQPPDARAR